MYSLDLLSRTLSLNKQIQAYERKAQRDRFGLIVGILGRERINGVLVDK
jgi:hypothetical protein